MPDPKGEHCPPTWEAAVRIHLECLMHGASYKAKTAAQVEIIMCAQQLDKAQAFIKEHNV